MKLFLSSDIEGTCGITDWAETERSTPNDYGYFQKQMTKEVRAACDGALDAGVTEIFVRDAHDTARNIDPSALPECASIMRGWAGDPYSMMSGIEAGGFDAVAFTGYHAWAACPGNPLSHTMNTGNEFVTLNGVRMSEFMMNAYTAGYFGVPVCFLSGDRALCDFAREFIPGIATVAVSRGVGGATVSMHPGAAVKAIRAGVAEGVKNRARCVVKLPDHFDIVVRFQKHEAAYSRSFYPGARLEDGKSVCYSAADYMDILRFSHFVLSI
ncbi:MAG TPA: M55 family metallopeptidase [Oscillospiraceae bacterium]|nr:M55 family metallopeptidase [Oscillospiraceae bacterium]